MTISFRHALADDIRSFRRDMYYRIPEEYEESDIMVKPKQRIEDICDQLMNNGFLPLKSCKDQIRVYSMRQMAYVNPLLTFRQARIYAGDILLVYSRGQRAGRTGVHGPLAAAARVAYPAACSGNPDSRKQQDEKRGQI